MVWPIQVGRFWFGFHLSSIWFLPDPFYYYIGLKVIKKRVHFDDGLFGCHLVSIEITLQNMNDNKTN